MGQSLHKEDFFITNNMNNDSLLGWHCGQAVRVLDLQLDQPLVQVLL